MTTRNFRLVFPDSAIAKAHKQKQKLPTSFSMVLHHISKRWFWQKYRNKNYLCHSAWYCTIYQRDGFGRSTETKIAYVIQHGIAPYIKEMVLAEVRDKQTETKIAYVIQHGIAPYIKEMVLAEVRDKPFTFKFDETTTEQIKKTI